MKKNFKHTSICFLFFFCLNIFVIPEMVYSQTDEAGQGSRFGENAASEDSDAITPEDFSGKRRAPRRQPSKQKEQQETPPVQNPPIDIPMQPASDNPTPIPTLIPAPTAAGSPSSRSGFIETTMSIPVVSAPVIAATPPIKAALGALTDFDFDGSAGIEKVRAHYPQNRALQYAIKVKWNGKPGEISVEVPQSLSLTNLHQVSGPVRKLQQAGDGHVVMAWIYTIKPISEGRASVGPALITGKARAGQGLPPIHVGQTDLIVSSARMGWAAWAGIAVGGILLLLGIIWALLVTGSLIQKKKYQDNMLDGLPSVDERLRSELNTLQVSMLVGNVTGYYEKISLLTRQLLKGRGFLDDTNLSNNEVISQLQQCGADKSYVDSVRSVLARCDAVLIGGENPDRAAQSNISQDIKDLLRVRITGPKIKEEKEENTLS